MRSTSGASACAAIAAFSSGVTHTLIGVDSLRVFPFLASISGDSRSASVCKGQWSLSAAGANKLKVAQREFYSRLNCLAV
jgi:hypothetical protein